MIPTAEEYDPAFCTIKEKVGGNTKRGAQRQWEVERQKKEKTGIKPDMKLVGARLEI